MLDVICPLNLGQNLARGCELIIRHANFRFASTGMVGENGLIWYHDCQSSDPIGHDPGLCDLEILHKFTKVFSLAGRLEYIHSDAALVPKFGPAGLVTVFPTVHNVQTPAQDDFSATLTASFNIWDNLLTRIEYRIDDFSGSSTLSGTSPQVIGRSSVQNEISLNAVYPF